MENTQDKQATESAASWSADFGSGDSLASSTGSVFFRWLDKAGYGTVTSDSQLALMSAWNGAIQNALDEIPGGQICDPQMVSDNIRSLLIPNDGTELRAPEKEL